MAKKKKTKEQPKAKGTENQAGIAGDGAGTARLRGASAARPTAVGTFRSSKSLGAWVLHTNKARSHLQPLTADA
jgi:hypothetical protein